jgi:hypothetical protein
MARRDDADDDQLPPRPPKSNLGLVLGVIAGVLLLFCGAGIAGVYYLIVKARDAVQDVVQQFEDAQHLAKDKESETNLRTLGIALENYRATMAGMPANTYHNQTRQPLLSWRVHLLPFLEEANLYQQFKLDEPWDSAHNIRLLPRMPAIYASVESRKQNLNDRTFIRGLTGPGGALESQRRNQNAQGPGIAQFNDGLVSTALAFEASEPVEWTKPDELVWPANAVRPKGMPNDFVPAGSPAYFWVLMGDGEPKRVKRQADNDALRRLFIRNDALPLLDTVWYKP